MCGFRSYWIHSPPGNWRYDRHNCRWICYLKKIASANIEKQWSWNFRWIQWNRPKSPFPSLRSCRSTSADPSYRDPLSNFNMNEMARERKKEKKKAKEKSAEIRELSLCWLLKKHMHGAAGKMGRPFLLVYLLNIECVVWKQMI